MNSFYHKEIGGILGAIVVSTSPVLASQTPGYSPSYPNKWDRVRLADYNQQEGYSETTTCFKEQYREEYVPGTKDNPGYIKSWTDTIEYPCRRTRVQRTPDNTHRTRTYEEYDENDCSDGTIAGALLGGGLAGFGSRGKDRWWAIPAGIIGGSMVGCAMDGG